MHSDRDVTRRQARTAALSRSWYSREGTLYVNGAGPVSGIATIAVADAQGGVVRMASIRARKLNWGSHPSPETLDYGLPYNKFLKSICMSGTRNPSRHRAVPSSGRIGRTFIIYLGCVRRSQDSCQCVILLLRSGKRCWGARRPAGRDCL
ncbi:hypothetical protein HPB47_020000 [Ixodes persulcatus]|uniref:Uncharacterized protein n=1 Tax=Ixodes persulcatus TaxID=34615 RepID=A0AC60QGR0_IXOPE|nr:hypothetical protein HPB47_020000 [Ixodes persulcatus]